jgi:ketosteroid isomerase-like protein
MKRVYTLAPLALLVGVAAAPAVAADVTEAELLRAATELGRQYDADYADKNPVAMSALYASDGVLVSPSGPVVRGRDALKTYYTDRFASGARDHAIKIVEVHVQGNGGYGLAQFSVTVPRANGDLHEEHGSIVAVYQRDPDGWHMRLVEPSVPQSGGK